MRLLFVLATLIAFASQPFAQGEILIGDVPVPSDARINDSGSSPFIGVWTGRWDSWRNHILAAEGDDDGGLFYVVYFVGRGPHSGGNWFRTEARVDGERPSAFYLEGLTPRTLTPGPGDHLDFVCIPTDSNYVANTLLNTEIEEEPI